MFGDLYQFAVGGERVDPLKRARFLEPRFLGMDRHGAPFARSGRDTGVPQRTGAADRRVELKGLDAHPRPVSVTPGA